MNIEKTWYGPACYQIKITVRLGDPWSDWYGGMTITYQEGITTISGEVLDQAALHGLLMRIRDLGLELISVNPLESNIQDNE